MKESERESPPDTADRLREQAQEIREVATQRLGRGGRALAPWQQILAVPLVILVLAASVMLLLAGDLRARLLERVAASWFVAFQQPPEIYRLPPPPPRPARADLHFSSQPIPDSPPLMVPVGGAVMGSAPAPESSPAEFTPPAKNPDWESAFQVLQEESEVVGKLIDGAVSGLRFQEWEPLRATLPRYSIKLDIFRESDQRVVAFAWSVDVSTRQTRPENQEARDLFFKLRRQ